MPPSSTSPFSPNELADELGPGDSKPGSSTVRALHTALVDPPSPVESRLEKWHATFAKGFGETALREATDNDAMASLYGVDSRHPERLLFAVHTYFALVVKLVALRIAADRDDPFGGRPHSVCESLEAPTTWSDRDLDRFLKGDCFDWYLEAWTETLAESIEPILERIDALFETGDDTGPTDLFAPLYQALVPPEVRHGLGEYYTPRWLAETTLDAVDYDGAPDQRILDPTCGSGTYLVEILRRAGRWFDDHGHETKLTNGQFARRLCDNLAGFDVNPLAVLAARTNVLAALNGFLDAPPRLDPPVYCCDALPAAGTVDLFDDTRSAPDLEAFDLVVGNPPWVNWQHLSQSQRDRTKPLWNRYGLFSLSGTEGRLGGGKKDLSMLVVYACCERYLAEGGRLGMLMTRSVLKSRKAGAGFRRFRFETDGDQVFLNPLEVHDFTDLQPFEGATTETALISLEKATEPTEYPVPYRVWRATEPGRIPPDATAQQARRRLERLDRAARPVEPDDDTSPWLTAPPDVLAGISKVVGSSDYTAFEGVNSGGLNACYWVRELEQTDETHTLVENLADAGRIDVDRVRTTVETDRLFPLLRSGDLQRWDAAPNDSIILAQDPETRSGIPEAEMSERFPETLEYFRRFEGDVDDPTRGTLRGRSLFRRYYDPSDPFYSMYGVGPYTMADWKVCWTRIDTRLRAAVVGPDDRGRPVLPQETITFVPFDEPDEAHYFCALFNSAPADCLVRHYSSGKGFASAHILETLGIPAFDDSGVHRRLADLSRRCHDDGEHHALRTAIDESAARIWGLEADELEPLLED